MLDFDTDAVYGVERFVIFEHRITAYCLKITTSQCHTIETRF